jgi:hydroxymethylbilane synthase
MDFRSMQALKIISRNSPLAVWQAELVKERLTSLYPDLQISILGIATQGDKILDKSLDKIGGKGLFIKELETALLRGEADIAVHSLKDLPANLLPEFTLAAILERDDPRDAFISNYYADLTAMPAGAIIGTSSARRLALLHKYYPHLQVKLLRGNLQTRLRKLDNGEYDAIILAAAGLKRLGLMQRIRQLLNVEQFIPAIGQGALAIEILHNCPQLANLLKPLTHEDSYIATSAEREVGRYLAASCSVPIAVYATILYDQITIKAMLADSTAGIYYFAEAVADKQDYLAAATRCASQLIAQGALTLLERYR